MPDETRHESEDLEDYEVEDSTDTLIGAIRDLATVKNMARLRPLWQAATPRPTRESH